MLRIRTQIHTQIAIREKEILPVSHINCGAAGEDRTRDLSLTNVVFCPAIPCFLSNLTFKKDAFDSHSNKNTYPIHTQILKAVVYVIIFHVLTAPISARADECPTKHEIITAHYEAIILEITGEYYRPEYMPPERKPVPREPITVVEFEVRDE